MGRAGNNFADGTRVVDFGLAWDEVGDDCTDSVSGMFGDGSFEAVGDSDLGVGCVVADGRRFVSGRSDRENGTGKDDGWGIAPGGTLGLLANDCPLDDRVYLFDVDEQHGCGCANYATGDYDGGECCGARFFWRCVWVFAGDGVTDFNTAECAGIQRRRAEVERYGGPGDFDWDYWAGGDGDPGGEMVGMARVDIERASQLMRSFLVCCWS